MAECGTLVDAGPIRLGGWALDCVLAVCRASLGGGGHDRGGDFIHVVVPRGCGQGASEGIAVKLSVDSSEPLEDAMRVLGALYGVTLVVASEAENGLTSAKQGASRGTKRAGAKAGSGGRGAAKGAGAARDRSAATSVSPVGNAEVRAWARLTGVTVRDRGRVPASVVNAYREAHNH
jgi:hypothetical protein